MTKETQQLIDNCLERIIQTVETGCLESDSPNSYDYDEYLQNQLWEILPYIEKKLEGII